MSASLLWARPSRLWCVAALAVVTLLADATPALADLSFTTLDVPSASNTSAQGVLGGTVVGEYFTNGTSHGFIYDGSTYTVLDDPNAGQQGTYATGISGNTVVGNYYDTRSVHHGFSYNSISSAYTTLDDPSATLGTSGFGISGSTVVGYYQNTSGFHGFVYNGSTYTTLDDPSAVHGTFALGISGSTIVGNFLDVGGRSHGFVYNGSTYTTLDEPLASPTGLPGQASGTMVNGIWGGKIVGNYYDAAGVSHGFMYDGSTFTTIDDPSAELVFPGNGTFATGVSGNTVVGYYFQNATTHGFIVTLPEPLAGCVLGMSGLTLLCKRRRNQPAV